MYICEHNICIHIYINIQALCRVHLDVDVSGYMTRKKNNNSPT